jgi:hypothetical protein
MGSPPYMNKRELPLDATEDSPRGPKLVDQDIADESSESELALGIGALSIDDALDVRYHGKTSGLHLLVKRSTARPSQFKVSVDPADNGSPTPRNSGGLPRERGGLFHFPPPGVWPPVDNSMDNRESHESSDLTMFAFNLRWLFRRRDARSSNAFRPIARLKRI